MKVIELLNKIANGEEVPKKIKYKDDIYTHVDNNCYVCEETYEILSNSIYAEHNSLNDEVETIEEDKKDKEIEIYVNGEKVDITDIFEPLKQGEYFYKENDKWYVHKLKNVSFVMEKDKKIKRIGKLNQVEDKQNLNNYMLRDKINEIIDYLNKEREQ